MKTQVSMLLGVLIALGCSGSVFAQVTGEGVRTGRLLKRAGENGVDNYPFATFSFEFGGNGPEVQTLCP